MDLSRGLCTPKTPRCEQCPLSSECAAATTNHELTLHSKRQRHIAHRDVIWPLAIVRCRGKILLRRRSAIGPLARLWELPGGEAKRSDQVLSTLRSELAELGYKRIRPRPIAEIRHSMTNRRIRAPVFLIECPAAAALKLGGKGWRWIAPASGQQHAVSSMTLKALKSLDR
jgi:A/G-specific adenine glycosylase